MESFTYLHTPTNFFLRYNIIFIDFWNWNTNKTELGSVSLFNLLDN
jgi:hypothetical protein